jgi:threonine-phosphate decarboxylase
MSQRFQTLLPAHGGQLRQIAMRYGVPGKNLVDFSANINPAGPPLQVVTAIRNALDDSFSLAEYPDLESTELKTAIAQSVDLTPGNICVANGFAPLLDAALRSLNITRCLLPLPAFSEYRKRLEGSNVTVVPHLLSSDHDFVYAADTLLQAMRDNHCDAILLANPQNPSGVLGELDQILKLLGYAERNGITVLLDEAFIDYCPTHSLIRAAAIQSRLIVFRSVTKFYAIPGLRIAYAACNNSMAKTLNRLIAPWPITTLASYAVPAALSDENYARQSRNENERQRSWLKQELLRMKINTYPSQTNFLLLRLPTNVDTDLLWERMIVEHQIVLRSCVNFERLDAGHLRSAVRSERDNLQLIKALQQVLPRC